MKTKKKFTRKLQLNKNTITNLNAVTMNDVMGGADTDFCHLTEGTCTCLRGGETNCARACYGNETVFAVTCNTNEQSCQAPC